MRFHPALGHLSFPSGASASLLWQSAVAVITAIFLLLSFPPFDLPILSLIFLAPFLFVIARGVRALRAFWLGLMVWIEFTVFAENWMAHSMTVFGGMLTVVSYAVALFFASILALFPAIVALVMARLVNLWGGRMMALAPIVWTAAEWIRPMVTGVTWNALGISQYRNYFIARLAQYGGVYLISAFIVAGNTLLVMAVISVTMKERAILIK